MHKLNLPPIEEVRAIVLDMVPVEAPNADAETIEQSIILAESFISFFHLAVPTTVTGKILQRILSGIISTKRCVNEEPD